MTKPMQDYEIVVRVEPGFTPVEGDAFDAVMAALDFADIPASIAQRKAPPANTMLVSQFMTELLASVETLGGIAETYGHATLADVISLIQAINDAGTIDAPPEESSILELVGNLPSHDKWSEYVNKES